MSMGWKTLGACSLEKRSLNPEDMIHFQYLKSFHKKKDREILFLATDDETLSYVFKLQQSKLRLNFMKTNKYKINRTMEKTA